MKLNENNIFLSFIFTKKNSSLFPLFASSPSEKNNFSARPNKNRNNNKKEKEIIFVIHHDFWSQHATTLNSSSRPLSAYPETTNRNKIPDMSWLNYTRFMVVEGSDCGSLMILLVKLYCLLLPHRAHENWVRVCVWEDQWNLSIERLRSVVFTKFPCGLSTADPSWALEGCIEMLKLSSSSQFMQICLCQKNSIPSKVASSVRFLLVGLKQKRTFRSFCNPKVPGENFIKFCVFAYENIFFYLPLVPRDIYTTTCVCNLGLTSFFNGKMKIHLIFLTLYNYSINLTIHRQNIFEEMPATSLPSSFISSGHENSLFFYYR